MCSAFLSRPAAIPTRLGNSRPITVTGDGGDARQHDLRHACTSRRRRGPRTRRGARLRDRARTGAGEKADRACKGGNGRSAMIRICGGRCAMIPFAQAPPSDRHDRASYLVIACVARAGSARRCAAPQGTAPAVRRAIYAQARGRAGLHRRRWPTTQDSTARRSCARSTPRATSRRSSPRCSGRCSSRRNGTSTRRRSSPPARIDGGVAFWNAHAAALARAEAEFGVPAGSHRRDPRRRDVLRPQHRRAIARSTRWPRSPSTTRAAPPSFAAS